MSLVLNDFIRIGNVGTEIIVTLKEDVGSAQVAVDLSTLTLDSQTIEVRKPRGTIVSLAATIKNPPGTDGKITHTDSTGIFDRRGRWQGRGRINITGGSIFKGSWTGFQVSE